MVTFWPRQEVLQLIIQQLANSGGKVLTNELVVSVVKQLSKQQTPEGDISFDRWLVVAKELLRWNDSCLQLFWEMLLLALSYSKEQKRSYDDTGVDLAFLAIFLVLHTSDLQFRTNLPGSNYDTVWPEPDVVLSPPSAQISSPSKMHGANIRVMLSSGPPSPKSPVSSPRNGGHSVLLPTSPKRMSASSPRQGKSASHYLYGIRQKLPIILRAITIDDSALGSENADSISLALEGLGGVSGGGGISGSGARGLEFMVSRKAVDSLGLIIAGGFSREDQVSRISTLHPIWSNTPPRKQYLLNKDSLIERPDYIPYSELSDWLDSNLCLNELLYPTGNSGSNNNNNNSSSSNNNSSNNFSTVSPLYSTNSTSTSTLTSTGLVGLLSPKYSSTVLPTSSYENENSNVSTSSQSDGIYVQDQKPSRTIVSHSSLCNTKPTVIAGCNTTVMYLSIADDMIKNKNSKFDDNNSNSNTDIDNNNSNSSNNINNNIKQRDENLMNVSDGGGGNSNGSGNSSERGGGGVYNSQSSSQSLLQSKKSTNSLSSVMSVSDQEILEQDALGDNTDSNVESDSCMSEGGGNSSNENTSSSNNNNNNFKHSDSDRNNNGVRREKEMKNKIVSVQESCNKSDNEGGGGTGRRRGSNSLGAIETGRKGIGKDRNDADNELDDCESESEIGGEEFSISKPDDGVDELDALKGYSVRRRRRRRAFSVVGLVDLPHLSIISSQGAHMHYLSAYSCVSITNCNDCEIVIGAVSGAIVVHGCERIKLTVACRKLIIQNSLECELHIATLTPSVISGDSRSLSFGPFNTAYKHHRFHLRAAGLSILYSNDQRKAENSAYVGVKTNFWSSLCDVNTCLEAIPSSNSPSGYALDAADHTSFSQLLPIPPASTAYLLPPERFKFLSIPCKSEYLPAARCAIALPPLYLANLETKKQAILKFNESLECLNDKSPSSAADSLSGSKGGNGFFMRAENNVKTDSMKYISAKFMEWLIATDSVQHVLDLVKVDGERIANNSNGNNLGSKSNDCDSLVNAFVMRSELFSDPK